MKKKLLTLFIVVCLMCALLPFGALADGEESGTCGENATWILKDGVLTISGTGEIEQGDWWENKVTSIVINKGITGIGEYAFEDCSALTSVIIPNSVTSIGEHAFYDCYSLGNITIPNSVTSIGDGAFCVCESLKSVTIPNKVTSIGGCAFAYCAALESISIPNSVTSIGDGAFEGCVSLKSINIPNGVKRIGESAFTYCVKLSKITIPDSVKTIGEGTFDECGNLKSIEVSSNNANYSSKDGVLFNKNKTELVAYPDGKTDNSYAIPSSVKVIGNWAFSGNENLTSIEIPNSVESIRDGAFANSRKLNEISIPSSVTKIGICVFNNCRELKSINVSSNNKNYSSEYGVLFNKDQSALNTYPSGKADTSYRVPSSVTEIQYQAFFRSKNLTSVYMPTSVKKIDMHSFSCTDKLKDIYYEGTQSQWNNTKCFHLGDNSELDIKCLMLENKGITLHFNAKMPAEKHDAPAKNPFKDIKTNDYYYNPILWAYSHKPQITKGIDDIHFAPNSYCTRGQIVTFLWRACGEPQVKDVKNPFKDVKSSDYYYNAVLWAVKNQITKGIDDTHFGPNNSCTRGQAVTFMWRAEGKPIVKGTCPFKDVSNKEFYYDAMQWAVGNDITNGVDKTHFAPNNTCTRGQIVTFLYRDMD